jgi:hypothetical protein
MDRLTAAEKSVNEARGNLAAVRDTWLAMRREARRARALGEATLEQEIALLEQAKIVRKSQARLREAEANLDEVLADYQKQEQSSEGETE